MSPFVVMLINECGVMLNGMLAMAALIKRITYLVIPILDQIDLIKLCTIPGGGIDGQVLTKNTGESFVTEWRNPNAGVSPNHINGVTFIWDFFECVNKC